MSEFTGKLHNKNLCRAVFASTSLLAMLIAASLVVGFIEKIHDAADRAT